MHSGGAGGKGGAKGPDHAVWLTIFSFSSSSIRSSVFFFQGRNWLYDPTHCHESDRKTFLVCSKVHDLFHDRTRGFGLYALNDCGLGCCVDLRGTYLGES